MNSAVELQRRIARLENAQCAQALDHLLGQLAGLEDAGRTAEAAVLAQALNQAEASLWVPRSSSGGGR